MKNIELLIHNIEEERKNLINHDIYNKLTILKDLQLFMESHVFAVWDFMSLLKALQRNLTCIEVPWVPVGDPALRLLINDIVMGEETDVDKDGKPASHYELYLHAMKDAGASTIEIESFVNQLKQTKDIRTLIAGVSKIHVRDFLNFTFDVIGTNKLYVIAAVFTFGREDLIPEMFSQIIKDIKEEESVDLDKFIYYAERHIELDGDHHGPLALKMIEELCGDDEIKWSEATDFSIKALQLRNQLWNGILDEIKAKGVPA